MTTTKSSQFTKEEIERLKILEQRIPTCSYPWHQHSITFDLSEKEGFEELCGDFEEELDSLFQTLSKFSTEDEAILYLYKSINEPITAKQLADYKSNPNFERLLSGAFSMHFNNMTAEALLKRDDILMDLGYSQEEIEDLRSRG